MHEPAQKIAAVCIPQRAAWYAEGSLTCSGCNPTACGCSHPHRPTHVEVPPSPDASWYPPHPPTQVGTHLDIRRRSKSQCYDVALVIRAMQFFSCCKNAGCLCCHVLLGAFPASRFSQIYNLRGWSPFWNRNYDDVLVVCDVQWQFFQTYFLFTVSMQRFSVKGLYDRLPSARKWTGAWRRWRTIEPVLFFNGLCRTVFPLRFLQVGWCPKSAVKIKRNLGALGRFS